MNDFKRIVDYYSSHPQEECDWDAIADTINDIVSNKYGEGYLRPREQMVTILKGGSDAQEKV